MPAGKAMAIMQEETGDHLAADAVQALAEFVTQGQPGPRGHLVRASRSGYR